MAKMNIEDFDIITILGKNLDLPMYKVKRKSTNEYNVFHTINLENQQHDDFIRNKINTRINTRHAHLLKVYGLIEQNNSKIGYVVTEFCENYDLKTVMERCTENKLTLSEELICKILYQIAVFIRTADIIESISIDKIFLDKNFTTKLYNFSLNKEPCIVKLSDLGIIFYELCTLQTFIKENIEIIKYNNTTTYSNSLLSLILYMINDKENIKNNINKILCHPTVVVKSSQWNEESFFIPPKNINETESEIDEITIQMGKLRRKELALRVQKRKLEEWKISLQYKSKEIELLERTVKEKLQQAELYLKRCKSFKKINNSGKDDLDATYVSCIDFASTSQKLNLNEIVKPETFTRTLEEESMKKKKNKKKIRFKGHSPLKEIDLNSRRRNNVRFSKPLEKKANSWLTCSEESEKYSVDTNCKILKGKQSLFCENITDVEEASRHHPIEWSKKSKKQAFDLLRTMNNINRNLKETKL